jgi:hypothetical protein
VEWPVEILVFEWVLDVYLIALGMSLQDFIKTDFALFI